MLKLIEKKLIEKRNKERHEVIKLQLQKAYLGVLGTED